MATQPIIIEIPLIGEVEFPSIMSEEEITAAAAKLYKEASPPGVEEAPEEAQFSKRVGQLFDFLASPVVQQRIVEPGQRTLDAARRLAEFGITPETFDKDIPLAERISGTALRALSGLVEVALAPFALPLEAAIGPELLKPFSQLGEEAGELGAALTEPMRQMPGLRDIQPVAEEAARLAGGFAPYLPFAAAGVAARPRAPARGALERLPAPPKVAPRRAELLRPPDQRLAETLRTESDRLQARIKDVEGADRVLAEQRIAENREMLAEVEVAFRPKISKLPKLPERGVFAPEGQKPALELLGAQESGGEIILKFGPESVVTKGTIEQLFKGFEIEVTKQRSLHTTLGADPRMVQAFRVSFWAEGNRLSPTLAKRALQERLGGTQRFTTESIRQRLEKAGVLRKPKVGERGSLRIMGELPSEIEVMPRAADLAPMLEFFVSPSKAFGKVHPAAGEIARRTIETTENIARDTAKAIGEYETVWRPLKAKEAQRVIRLLDNPDVTPSSVPPNTPTRVREAYVRTRALLDSQRERINQAREAAGIPPITGVTEGYWPHVFQGSWGVTKLVGEKWSPIETGWLADSQVSGIAKAREYLAQNPGTRLRIELKKLHFQPEEATILPRGSYFRLMNRLSKMTAAEVDPSGEIRVGPMGRGPAFERLRGVARPGARKPGKAFFGHVQPRRTDLAGWLEDPKALEILIRGAERYIGMTPLRAGAAKLREQVQREAPEATRLHSQLDSYIDAAILGRPDRFTQSFNALWEHVGERMGLTAKPAALQRISRTVNQVQSMTKLGFSPVSAFVNLSQTALNTYPTLGAKWTTRGIRDYVAGKNKWLIDELGIKQQISKVEEANFRDYMAAQWPRTAREVPHFAWRGTVDTSLFLFRHAENANRSVASLGAYARAKARGLSDVAAVAEARDVLTQTQFVYGPADSPAVLRAAWVRVPGQFKTFMLKEMEFILNLKGWEVPRFMAALTLATGAAGVPGAMLLNEMVETVSGWMGEPYSPLEDLRVKARRLKGIKGVAARALTMGLPSALGVDLVRNIGFQEYFSPGMLRLRSLLGPTGNDLTNLVSVAVANPGRDRQQALRTLTAGLSPSARRLSTLLSQKGKLINPRTKQVILDDIEPWEAVALAMGFTPNRVAQVRDVEWAITKEVLEDRSLKGSYVDQVAEGMISENEAYDAGRLEEAKRHAAEWEALANKAAEVGFPDIRRAARLRAIKLARPQLQERLRRVPRRMRKRIGEELLPPNEVMLKAKEGEITPAEANRLIPRRQRAIKLLRPPPQE